ncbi:hypothetical protein ECANGB1_1743 [Enterospora canceri]|uniref:Uncharacterized protein n=1 Tax=Enterospora canceri TaxID=1081671 RepID=A0A1Y1S5L8_9MICR|nr:hypothetical protein ECANGB1_1743 [Enterospora canceri]
MAMQFNIFLYQYFHEKPYSFFELLFYYVYSTYKRCIFVCNVRFLYNDVIMLMLCSTIYYLLNIKNIL